MPAPAKRRHAVFLMGPTGSGKSELAIGLAQSLPFEILSVDSAQVYRGMDIGTAKPDAATQARVPHHLIDIREPTEGYSAGEFLNDAWRVMQGIWERGRQPLLVGGTMLYFHALTAGIADLPGADLGVRAGIDALAASEGWGAVHRALARVDPMAAARIHANDPQRLQRALEVYRITGEPISRLQAQRVSVLSDIEVKEIVLSPLERIQLHTRIESRFDAMLESGLLAEVAALYKRSDLTAEHPSMRAVGYRQLWRHLAERTTLSEARNEAIAATRQLAKRQLTWLRKRERAQWFDSTHPQVARMVADALPEGMRAESFGATQ